KEFKTINELTQDDLGEEVFSYIGKELNVKTIKDFHMLKEDYLSYIELENKLFPDGILNYIKNEDRYKDKFLAINNKFKLFCDKWFAKDKYTLEKQFGELLDCYIHLKKV